MKKMQHRSLTLRPHKTAYNKMAYNKMGNLSIARKYCVVTGKKSGLQQCKELCEV